MGQREKSARLAASADSLARRLPDETERWTVQLRLSNLEKPFLVRRDSLYALLAPRRPHSRVVLITKAAIAQLHHDIPGETAAWQDLLQNDPNEAAAYNQLGYLAARQGHYAEAKSYLKKYAFLAPQLANPHDSLGEILIYSGDYEEAESELRQALTIQPDFFPSLINLGALYIEQGEVKKGAGLLEKVRKTIAGTAWEQRVDGILIQTYYDNDLRPQMIAEIDNWIAEFPKDWQTNYFRALKLMFTGQTAAADAATASFIATAQREPAYRLSPSFQRQVKIIPHLLRALSAHERGDNATAADELGQALALQPDEPPYSIWPWKYRYGAVLLALGRNEEALDQAREVLAYNPRRLRVLLLQARAQAALGRTEDARATIEQLRKNLGRADPDLAVVTEAESLAATLGVKPPA
jgi:tetratricopeptide (TPR) repeat protein